MTEEFEEKMRKRIDEFLDEKRFTEAATLAVHMALLHIKPEELVQLLLNAVKEWKEKHEFLDSKQARYLTEFKKPSIQTSEFNPFKITKCYHCTQRVVMRLINDPLSNSSYWIYAGACVNGHWNQVMPGSPDDLKEPPRCKVCNSTMQWKMSVEFNGWICANSHEETKHP